MDRRILVVGLVMVAMVAARPSAKKLFKQALERRRDSSRGSEHADMEEMVKEAIAAGPVKKEELETFVGTFKTMLDDIEVRYEDIEKETASADDVVTMLAAVVENVHEIGEDYENVQISAFSLMFRTYVLGFVDQATDCNESNFEECMHRQFEGLGKEVEAVVGELIANFPDDKSCTALRTVVDEMRSATDVLDVIGSGEKASAKNYNKKQGKKRGGGDKPGRRPNKPSEGPVIDPASLDEQTIENIKGAIVKDFGCLRDQFSIARTTLGATVANKANENVYDAVKKDFVKTLIFMHFLRDGAVRVLMSVERLGRLLGGGSGSRDFPSGEGPRRPSGEGPEAGSGKPSGERPETGADLKVFLRNFVKAAADEDVSDELSGDSSVSLDGSDSSDQAGGAKVNRLVRQLIKVLGQGKKGGKRPGNGEGTRPSGQGEFDGSRPSGQGSGDGSGRPNRPPRPSGEDEDDSLSSGSRPPPPPREEGAVRYARMLKALEKKLQSLKANKKHL